MLQFVHHAAHLVLFFMNDGLRAVTHNDLSVGLDPAMDMAKMSGGRGVTFRAKAPLRVSFAGGGTDVKPFPTTDGGCVLSATIDRFAYGSLRSRTDRQITIESVDFGTSLDFGVKDPIMFDGKLDLVKAVIRELGASEEEGYDLLLHSSAAPGSGLGSSSTVMVCLIGLLKERYKLNLNEYEIAQMAYQVEREQLAIQGGSQDQYSAVFGGFNFMEFDGSSVVVNPLRIRDDTVNELEHNMLLAYTGITRASSEIIEDQTERLEAGSQETILGLREQKRLAVEMKVALLRNELSLFGELLGHAWEQKKRMSTKITNGYIDEIYAAARGHGALGGKVTGAGGGGYVLLYCDFHTKHKVAEVLSSMGATVEEFAFAPRGLVTWRAND
jgi:D-glycero-alpha-D-manno-heptose-7-phosphate kinase